MKPVERIFPNWREFARDHIIWILGLLPLVLAGIKLFAVSEGDPEVFRFLLRDLNVVQLVIATVVPFAPLVIFWTYVVWLDWIRRTPAAVRNQVMPEWLDQPIWNAAMLIVLIMPTFQILISIAILMFLFFRRRRARKKAELRWGANHGQTLAPIYWSARGFLFGLVLQGLIGSSGSWFPAEAVKVRGSDVQAAYVISYDRDWTTVLDSHKKIKLYKTESVESRSACIGDWTWLGRPITKVFSSAPEPICPG
ncbi:hypothetical protein OK015_20380 [Mycobacterium sp. Aquia_216]|uniref:hypothetical protein n=1 Tax=Mycobacterium sp. Aquia_216 TaxID=2991729 RepID=UPI00227AE33F|nr:hypothetical protein [Mycobacterium sp. Aquia_216]WAJ43542.1 hypothetical protein OK015_20380 [Mycobacterium sp. Aquia_216]